MGPFNLSTVDHRELSSRMTGEKYSRSAMLTDLVKFKNMLVHHDIISPGARASSSHTHTHREEMVLVLEGYPTVYLGPHEIQLRPGDFFGFSPSNEPHCVANNGACEVRILVMASNPPEDETVFEGNHVADAERCRTPES